MPGRDRDRGADRVGTQTVTGARVDAGTGVEHGTGVRAEPGAGTEGVTVSVPEAGTGAGAGPLAWGAETGPGTGEDVGALTRRAP